MMLIACACSSLIWIPVGYSLMLSRDVTTKPVRVVVEAMYLRISSKDSSGQPDQSRLISLKRRCSTGFHLYPL